MFHSPYNLYIRRIHYTNCEVHSLRHSAQLVQTYLKVNKSLLNLAARSIPCFDSYGFYFFRSYFLICFIFLNKKEVNLFFYFFLFFNLIKMQSIKIRRSLTRRLTLSKKKSPVIKTTFFLRFTQERK